MSQILIVEKDKDLQSIFKLIFNTENTTVICCDDADSMYKSLQLAIPDLLILDIFPSGIDEKIICDDLRKRNALKNIPILIMSTRKEQVENYKSFCADDSIEKPFDLSVIRKKIDSLLATVT